MSSLNKTTCIGVKTILIDNEKIISFKCFSNGEIEKYDYMVPKWVTIGNGDGYQPGKGECVGFSIHMHEKNDRFLAVRWFKNGLVQQAHPGGVWTSIT